LEDAPFSRRVVSALGYVNPEPAVTVSHKGSS